MKSINKSIRKLEVYRNVIFVLVLYVFAAVHFLHFGELKLRFLQIDIFVSKKYILINFGCSEVSIRVTVWNTYKARIFPRWLVQSLIGNIKITVHIKVRFSVSLIWSCVLQFTIYFSLITIYPVMTSIYKPIRKLKVYRNVSFVLVS